jgi:hypothetical protein
MYMHVLYVHLCLQDFLGCVVICIYVHLCVYVHVFLCMCIYMLACMYGLGQVGVAWVVGGSFMGCVLYVCMYMFASTFLGAECMYVCVVCMYINFRKYVLGAEYMYVYIVFMYIRFRKYVLGAEYMCVLYYTLS